MESQPQNPEFRIYPIYPKNFHPCILASALISVLITSVSSEGSDKFVHTLRLTRAFIATIHIYKVYTKI